MSPQGRRKNTTVTAQLTAAPYAFPFVQTVRLLERAAVMHTVSGNEAGFATNPVGRFTPPSSEAIRFTSRHNLTFPAADIDRIETRGDAETRLQWRVRITFLGLAGAMGVMPYHYSELILNRQKIKDATIDHFFNLFNHRTASLFLQASCKYRLPLQYERQQLHRNNGSRDTITSALLALSGLGTPGLYNRLHTHDETLARFSGLFSQQVRNATGLRQILAAHFNIPVEIGQFSGQWQELIEDVRSRLPDLANPRGRNVQLGRSAMLGSKGWYAQGKIRIILGPLNGSQLQRFAPGTNTLQALNEIVRLYVGMEQAYQFIIRVNKADIPERIRMSRSEPPVMGWNTWLSKRSSADDGGRTMDIAVSPSRLE